MVPYAPPVSDMRFVLEEVAGLASIASLPGYEVATPDTVAAVLEQAADLARDVLAPINDSGDREGARLENGVVRTPAGFHDAYQAYVAGGWGGLPCPEEYGGQGLPLAVAAAVSEMWSAANLGFALCPMLTVGRGRGAGASRHRRTEGALPAASGLRRMDRHDEPDRTAGGLGCRSAEDPRGEAWRSLPHHRAEDLHHLRRPRSGGEHHPPGTGAHAGFAAGNARHFAVSSAEVPARCGWRTWPAQRRALRQPGAQTRYPC